MVSEVSTLRLRPAGARDVPFLVDLRNALASSFLSQFPATQAKTLRLLATSGTYITERDGKPVGSFSLYNIQGIKAEFGRFMVAPEAQGNGIGSWALERALEKAGEQRIRRLELMVREDNTEAINLYSKHGFTPVRRGPGYAVMRRNL